MIETKQQHWSRRGLELGKIRKAQLCAMYRQLGGLGGIHPPESWRKDEVVSSIVDIEWSRLPNDQKQPAPRHKSLACDECGRGEDAPAHAYGGSHHYTVTHTPDKPMVYSRGLCVAPRCGMSFEDHEAWELGHQYQGPTEEQQGENL